MNKLLQINNLRISFNNPQGKMTAVRGVSLSINEGETLALVGESGCGKTVTCKSMLHLLCPKGSVDEGEILFKNRDLIPVSEKVMTAYRGGEISMIFQNPMTSLDPGFSVGEQIAEVVRIHEGLGRQDAKARAIELMRMVQLDNAEEVYDRRPYQFSGGQRQRIAIAVAIAGKPKLLLADEPTTALDGETQTEILRLLKKLQEETKTAIIFITHDLSLVEDMAERVAIMKDGYIVEEGETKTVFANPHHEYTKKLLGYADYGKNRGHNHRGHAEGNWLLKVKGLCKDYGEGTVLDNFSMEIKEKEIVGLVGKSGCGKSTLARCIMGIEKYRAGDIKLREDTTVAMIFQDSQSSFNDKMTVEKIIAEPLVIKKGLVRKEVSEKVAAAMDAVELSGDFAKRKPYELSGGQRQRVAIARALVTEPDVIIADEPLTGLDVSAQAQIVHLLKRLSEERNMSILFIAHDIPMVNHVSDRIIET